MASDRSAVANGWPAGALAGAVTGSIGGLVGGAAYVLFGKAALHLVIGLVLGSLGGAGASAPSRRSTARTCTWASTPTCTPSRRAADRPRFPRPVANEWMPKWMPKISAAPLDDDDARVLE